MGVKRTTRVQCEMSVYDPKRTIRFAAHMCAFGGIGNIGVNDLYCRFRSQVVGIDQVRILIDGANISIRHLVTNSGQAY